MEAKESNEGREEEEEEEEPRNANEEKVQINCQFKFATNFKRLSKGKPENIS